MSYSDKYNAEWAKNASQEELEITLFTIDGWGTTVKRTVHEELIQRTIKSLDKTKK